MSVLYSYTASKKGGILFNASSTEDNHPMDLIKTICRE